MGLKFKILNEIRVSKSGLTVSELSDKIGSSKQIVRSIINRDLKPKLVKELGIKRNGNKVYVLTEEESDLELLIGLNQIMLTKMQPKAGLDPKERETIKKVLERVK